MTHPDVKVMLYFDSGLDIRRTIAAMENTSVGQYFIGKGPIHLIAPGGDELITRLQQRYYVLPDSRYPYATEPLTLIVPESQVDAPGSFEALAQVGSGAGCHRRSLLTQSWTEIRRAVDAARPC